MKNYAKINIQVFRIKQKKNQGGSDMEERKRQRERKSAAYWLSKCSVLYPIGILYVMYV